MPDAVRAELETLVARLRDDAKAGHGPVDLMRVAAYLGVEVAFGTGACEGSLRLREGRAVIELAEAPKTRQAFTFAHELGHAYMLHPHHGVSARSRRAWRNPERFADAFAAILLLPESWLAEIAPSQATLHGLEKVANAAGTSYSATLLRLRELGLWDAAMLTFRRQDDIWLLSAAYGVPYGRDAVAIPDETTAKLQRWSYGEAGRRVVEVLVKGRRQRIGVDVSPRANTILMFVFEAAPLWR